MSMPTEEQTYRAGVVRDLSEIKSDQQEIKRMVSFTNGKVRKIIIALVLLGGIIVGQSVTGYKDLIGLFTHFL